MITASIIVIAAVSGVISTLAAIFTRRAYRKVTHLEAQVGQYSPPEPPEKTGL
jgi:hypothetical protein